MLSSRPAVPALAAAAVLSFGLTATVAAAPAQAYDADRSSAQHAAAHSNGKSDNADKPGRGEKKDRVDRDDRGKDKAGSKDRSKSNGNGGRDDERGNKSDNAGKKDKKDKGNNGQGGSNGNGPKSSGPATGQGINSNPGQSGNGDKTDKTDKGPKSNGGGAGDPAGNNGTVKIAPLGATDSIPNNTPHPGCGFQVEWYGFDEGADIISDVSFAVHSPTRDAAMTVNGPSQVFVGGDPATGAGTETGLDGRQVYTLDFDGEAHPKQGYHVKLTVATPGSQGNDTKTKVFWVEDCDTETPTDAPTDTPTDAPTEVPGDEQVPDTGEALPGTPQQPVSTPSVTDENWMQVPGLEVVSPASGVTGDDTEAEDASGEVVLGVSGERDDATGDAGDDTAAVPTSVDAGGNGSGEESSVIDAATSPVGLLTILGGMLAAAGAVIVRRRATS